MSGWPRKDEGYRLYYEMDSKSYILLIIPEDRFHVSQFDGWGELMQNNDPEKPVLGTCSCTLEYLITWGNGMKVRRVQWDEIPEVWQDAFMGRVFNEDPQEDPMKIRGLWRVDNFPGKDDI